MIILEEEQRCGFLVTVQRKKIWNIQLGILEELKRVCKKYDIHYFAVCGTLLGVIRHQGFIPWDDDMDIGLLRDDYNKLINVAENEFSYPFFFQTSLNEQYYYSDVARLRHSESTGLVLSDKNKKCNNGIYIDIFPFDGLSDNRLFRKIHFFQIGILGKILRTSRLSIPDRNFTFLASKMITRIIGFNVLFKMYQKICSRYSSKKPERIAILSGNRKNSEFYYYREDVCYVFDSKFENTVIATPIGYDRCLSINYGNYYDFPPESERGNWHQDIVLFDPDVPFEVLQRKRGWI